MDDVKSMAAMEASKRAHGSLHRDWPSSRKSVPYPQRQVRRRLHMRVSVAMSRYDFAVRAEVKKQAGFLPVRQSRGHCSANNISPNVGACRRQQMEGLVVGKSSAGEPIACGQLRGGE